MRDDDSSYVLAALAAVCLAVALSMVARDHCVIQTPDLPRFGGTLGSPTPIAEE
jgi:hypothetical protein